MSIEQMVRDLLEVAIKNGLVRKVKDPQAYSSGDLVEVANWLEATLSSLHHHKPRPRLKRRSRERRSIGRAEP